MSKTTQVLSLSISPEVIEKLNKAKEKRGYTNRSKLASELFEDFSDLDLEAHMSLRESAKQRGVAVSELVEFLLDKFPLNDSSVKPIVLRIPVDAVNDKRTLEDWLYKKANVLVNHLYPKE